MVELSGVGESDEELGEVEPDGVGALEGEVDGDERVRFAGRGEQVLWAGVAVWERLGQLVELVEEAWDGCRDPDEVGAETFAVGGSTRGSSQSWWSWSDGRMGVTAPS